MEDYKRTIQAPSLNPYTLRRYNANLPTELHWILYHETMCNGNFKVEDLTDNVNTFWVKVHAHYISFIYKTVTLNLFVSAKWDIWISIELLSTQLFIGFYQYKLHDYMFEKKVGHLQASVWQKQNYLLTYSLHGAESFLRS